jgi:hypothetical protein
MLSYWWYLVTGGDQGTWKAVSVRWKESGLRLWPDLKAKDHTSLSVPRCGTCM